MNEVKLPVCDNMVINSYELLFQSTYTEHTPVCLRVTAVRPQSFGDRLPLTMRPGIREPQSHCFEGQLLAVSH